ncbi:growth-regulating factor 6-like [Mercurialis annua]|uniref:growth-regulating factor 6-like n=1 Tax=Mercurialis annua TaxID=3986 RepID=UPI00215EEB11|nr:growth-regulating factor 6-like [Mercurialis annua]XP_050210569.1 growth-regulating factor 6-like [Mercurialis annua]
MVVLKRHGCQKYYERHMNRDRHRSRKHVEGQSGHSAAATTTTNTKSTPNATLCSVSSSMVGLKGSGASNNVTIAQNQQQQLKNLQPDGLFNLFAATPLNRMFFSKNNLGERLQDSSSLKLNFKRQFKKYGDDEIPIGELLEKLMRDANRTEINWLPEICYRDGQHQGFLMKL